MSKLSSTRVAHFKQSVMTSTWAAGMEVDHWLQQDIEPDWLLDLDNQADPNANCPGLLDIEVDWLTDRTAATPGAASAHELYS